MLGKAAAWRFLEWVQENPQGLLDDPKKASHPIYAPWDWNICRHMYQKFEPFGMLTKMMRRFCFFSCVCFGK